MSFPTVLNLSNVCNLNLEELKAVVQVLISAIEPDIELPTSQFEDDNMCLLPVENQFELASKLLSLTLALVAPLTDIVI